LTHTQVMRTSTLQQPAAGASTPGGAGGSRGRALGLALMLGSGLSSQVGAATGALAFPVIGPAGVVAVRQWVAGVLLWTVGRPRGRRFTRPQWGPGLAPAPGFAP